MKAILVIVTIIVVTIVVVSAADRIFYKEFTDKAAEIKAAAGQFDSGKIMEEDLKHLPKPVAKYIRYCGLVGKERINYMHLTHTGSFRPGADKEMLPIEGEYYLTTYKPSFAWFGKIKMMPLITTTAFDSYFNGEGKMIVKLASIVKIVEAVSEETSRSALGRCFAEMTMSPSFFLDDKRIHWSESDSTTATCIFTDNDKSTDAKLYFNKDHSLDKIVVNRYYSSADGKQTLEKFTGKCSAYRDFNGLKIATVYDGYWNLRSGDLHYVHFVINEVKYE
jgi:hypothetical protein